MANNRIYIRCRRCGAILRLGKHFGRTYAPYSGIEDSLYDFFEEHGWEGADTENEDRGDFEIAYEFAPGGDREREI